MIDLRKQLRENFKRWGKEQDKIRDDLIFSFLIGEQEMKASKQQVGGNHYKTFEIQPAEYTTKNKLSFLVGCIIKRSSRYDKPGGKGLEDLRKIKHEVDLIIEFEDWEGKTANKNTDKDE